MVKRCAAEELRPRSGRQKCGKYIDLFSVFIHMSLELKTELIEYEESKIDPSSELYLITWAPDPKELPDADFYIQHNVNVELLTQFLKACACGIFCVEATQIGNPHYHGWYQVDPTKELVRIAVVKTMQRFAPKGLKIAPARSWKFFNWTERGNALYYYKKDICDAFLNVDPNPITKDSESTVNFDTIQWISFFDSRMKIDKSLTDKISDRRFYRSFYGDTLNHM